MRQIQTSKKHILVPGHAIHHPSTFCYRIECLGTRLVKHRLSEKYFWAFRLGYYRIYITTVQPTWTINYSDCVHDSQHSTVISSKCPQSSSEGQLMQSARQTSDELHGTSSNQIGWLELPRLQQWINKEHRVCVNNITIHISHMLRWS